MQVLTALSALFEHTAKHRPNAGNKEGIASVTLGIPQASRRTEMFMLAFDPAARQLRNRTWQAPIL